MAERWETLIDHQVASAKLCLATGDLTPLHVGVALRGIAPVPLSGVNPQALEELERIHKTAIEQIKSHLKAYSDSIEALKSEKPDPEDWNARINMKAEET
ncbi:hypothetical protein GGS20DRAFT_582633 [Poronia punctata]|nr:hypothetical protein GGS20DRAFT_582633 [Poronia punctata]